MDAIKITKALVDKRPLTLAPSWISNGHWAIKRSILNGQATWDSVAWSSAMNQVCREYDDQAMAELVPATERTWKSTGMVQMTPLGDVVLFESQDGVGHRLGLNRKYWTMVGEPEIVYAETIMSLVVGASKAWIVMPIEVKQ